MGVFCRATGGPFWPATTTIQLALKNSCPPRSTRIGVAGFSRYNDELLRRLPRRYSTETQELVQNNTALQYREDIRIGSLYDSELLWENNTALQYREDIRIGSLYDSELLWENNTALQYSDIYACSLCKDDTQNRREANLFFLLPWPESLSESAEKHYLAIVCLQQ